MGDSANAAARRKEALTPGNALRALAITMLVTGATILVASRGRHLAWPVFAAIAAAALWAAR